MNVILMGPPGAGKGTQAQRLAAAFGLSHLASGDVLRAERASGTALGEKVAGYMDSGALVPDEIIIAVILHRLAALGDSNGFLLDGFPRTVPQAESLEAALAKTGQQIDGVIDIQVPAEELVDRIVGRRTCPTCHSVYHVKAKPPKVAGVCDKDGTPLKQRTDDTEDVVRERLETYRRQTAPLTEHYRGKGLLHEVSGAGTMDAVYSEMERRLRALSGGSA